MAFRYKGLYFIGVTAAAAVGMIMLFKRMLSDSRILIQIGDPRGETKHSPLKRPLLLSLLEEIRRNGTPPEPKGVRSEFWGVLSQQAFLFLLLHELSHIRNGHVDYINSQKRPLLMEFGQERRSPEEALEMQALEIDADTCAMGFITKCVSKWARNPPTQNPHLQGYQRLLCVSLIAIFSFFRMFEDAPLAGADLCDSDHPADRSRFGTLVGSLRGLIGAEGGITEYQAVESIAFALFFTEQAFHILTGEPMPDHTRPEQFLYTETYAPVGMQHREKLIKLWEGGLRQKLEA